MPRLGVTPHDIFVVERTFRANGVGRLVDLSRRRPCAGKAKNIVDAVRLTPRHRLGSRVMPVAPEQDAGFRPAFSNMPHQPAKMSAHFDAGRRLAGPQDDGDRAASLGAVDMRARIISASVCVIRVESRRSGKQRANRSATPRRRSAIANNMTPPSDVRRPPSNAAVICLRETAGNENGRRLSCPFGEDRLD